MSTAPVAIELVEDAIATWVQQSTGATTYFAEPEDSGAPKPAPPRCQIRDLVLVRIGQPEIRKIPSIVQQRYTCAAGPGTVGVNFYTGVGLGEDPLVPTVISTVIGAISADDAALALLVELDADLPAGASAMIDPEDSASVLVDGSASLPLFAASSVFFDPGGGPITITTVKTQRERYPELEAEWSRWSWRLSFRALPTRGFGSAQDLLARAKKSMFRVFGPLARAAGWGLAGTLADLNSLPNDRGESLAIFDFALEGYATAAFNVPALRAVGLEITTAT